MPQCGIFCSNYTYICVTRNHQNLSLELCQILHELAYECIWIITCFVYSYRIDILIFGKSMMYKYAHVYGCFIYRGKHLSSQYMYNMYCLSVPVVLLTGSGGNNYVLST